MKFAGKGPKTGSRHWIPEIVTVALIVASFLASAVMGRAESWIPVHDSMFLNLIGPVEGPESYDSVSYFIDDEPPRRPQMMTIDEVLEFQREQRRKGVVSSAMGRYQFIYKTLKALVDDHAVPRDALFDRRTQDYLAKMLMVECGFYDPGLGSIDLGNCLARVWAALPVMSGPKKGQSYYASNINRAFVSPGDVKKVLDARFSRSSGDVVMSTKSPDIEAE